MLHTQVFKINALLNLQFGTIYFGHSFINAICKGLKIINSLFHLYLFMVIWEQMEHKIKIGVTKKLVYFRGIVLICPVDELQPYGYIVNPSLHFKSTRINKAKVNMSVNPSKLHVCTLLHSSLVAQRRFRYATFGSRQY